MIRLWKLKELKLLVLLPLSAPLRGETTTTYHLEHDFHERGKVYTHRKLLFLNHQCWTYRLHDGDDGIINDGGVTLVKVKGLHEEMMM